LRLFDGSLAQVSAQIVDANISAAEAAAIESESTQMLGTQCFTMLLLCALIAGVLAGFVTLWVIGPAHNVGVLFTTLLVAGAVALAVLIGGWFWIRRS
jgi:hypothetical protein